MRNRRTCVKSLSAERAIFAPNTTARGGSGSGSSNARRNWRNGVNFDYVLDLSSNALDALEEGTAADDPRPHALRGPRVRVDRRFDSAHSSPDQEGDD